MIAVIPLFSWFPPEGKLLAYWRFKASELLLLYSTIIFLIYSVSIRLKLEKIHIRNFFLAAIGDSDGHIGLGVKCSKEVATAIRGAIILAKLSVVPVRRGYWGNKINKPHTVPCKVSIVLKRLSIVILKMPESPSLLT